MTDRSPYEEQPDEKRPCPECGDTHYVEFDMQGQGQDCPLCGPPSKPDPEATRELFLRTAEMLRRQAERVHFGYEYRHACLEDAQYFERRVAQFTGSKEVA